MAETALEDHPRTRFQGSSFRNHFSGGSGFRGAWPPSSQLPQPGPVVTATTPPPGLRAPGLRALRGPLYTWLKPGDRGARSGVSAQDWLTALSRFLGSIRSWPFPRAHRALGDSVKRAALPAASSLLCGAFLL
ncbi:hypothetical protein H1C71_019568 [Ictidomys tridecemlineatus]|nr:hypothetical protein H1C71_019568 [Ictidomys tridecemlineatus]